jgi:ABC-2 type transport system permease protein
VNATIESPSPSRGPAAGVAEQSSLRARVGWAVADTWTVAGRDLTHWLRRPGPVLVGLLFPLLIVLMFGYLFGGQMSGFGDAGSGESGAGYREFLVPGVFGMTMLFGLETTMLAVTVDANRGITDRFRSLAMSPVAVVGGRSVADLLNSVLGLAVMIAGGLAIGWRWRDGLGPALHAVALLLLLRFALIWVGVYLGLMVKGPEAVAAVQILVWPLGFLSNAFIDPATMPGWLGTIAEWNPLSSTVSAVRELFGNPVGVQTSWITEHSLLMATLWPVLLLVVFVPLSVARYRRLSR